MSRIVTGGCCCGGVRYEVRGELRQIIACHCVQCRRTSGHFVTATACRRPAFKLMRSDTLKWYVAVPGYRRGFCGECGSSLFFEQQGGERVSIAAGSLDEPQGLTIVQHLFASEAGDYYRLDDGAAISPGKQHSIPLPPLPP
jgi:hypothetical protein